MSDEPKKRQGYGCFGLGVAFIAGALVGGCLSNVITRIAVQVVDSQKRHQDEREAVAPIIAKDPAFKDVQLREDSDGAIFIAGYVPTTADKKRLKELIARALGERGAERVTQVGARDEDAAIDATVPTNPRAKR
jgi:hypothetical protein